MWRDRIRTFSTQIEFSPPCTPQALARAEADLGVSLPPDLRELVLESNGVRGEYDLDLIWPVERIREDNLAFRSNAEFRELYMPFDPLLFFADAGNGDQFALVVLAGKISRNDVFVWDHESDSRTWVASTIDQYLDWWLSGKLVL
jgi:hypothetical protein